MKKNLLILSLFLISGCVTDEIPSGPTPVHLETRIDSNLLIMNTDDIRVADVKEKKIAYEYNDQNVKLSQIGEHAKRFCEGRGRDTVLVDMRLTNKHNFRRVVFECKDKPVLVP